jgi:hypothetical protein
MEYQMNGNFKTLKSDDGFEFRPEASMNYSERPPRAAILTSRPISTSSVLGWLAQRCSTTFIRDSRPALKSTCLRLEVSKAWDIGS